jgi:hypothetical protein
MRKLASLLAFIALCTALPARADQPSSARWLRLSSSFAANPCPSAHPCVWRKTDNTLHFGYLGVDTPLLSIGNWTFSSNNADVASGTMGVGLTNASSVSIGKAGNTISLLGKTSIPATTSGNAVTVTGNASNFSAQALFKDSNAKTHYGVDAGGLPSLGSVFDWREDWRWVTSTVNNATSGFVTNSGNVWWNSVSGTPTGLNGVTGGYAGTTANLLISINPGTANANSEVLETNGGVVNVGQLTNAYIVAEWQSALSIVGANNVTWFQGLTNGNISTAHPKGMWFQKASANTDWYACTDNLTTTTCTDTGVAPLANTLQTFRIEFYGSATMTGAATVRFWIDSQMVSSTTTTVYTGTLGLGWGFGGLLTAAASSQTMTVGAIRAVANAVATPLAP